MKSAFKIFAACALVATFLVAADDASAAPVTYTFSGTAGGTFDDGSGAVGFMGEQFKIEFTGDTANVDLSDDPFFRYFNIGGTIEVGSLSGTLTPTNTIVASAGLGLINFFNAGVTNGLGLQNAALSGYDLTSSIGPLNATLLTPTLGPGSFGLVGGGSVQFTGNSALSFTATVVPVPAALPLLGGGLALLGLLGWRRKRIA